MGGGGDTTLVEIVVAGGVIECGVGRRVRCGAGGGGGGEAVVVVLETVLGRPWQTRRGGSGLVVSGVRRRVYSNEVGMRERSWRQKRWW